MVMAQGSIGEEMPACNDAQDGEDHDGPLIQTGPSDRAAQLASCFTKEDHHHRAGHAKRRQKSGNQRDRKEDCAGFALVSCEQDRIL
jgi:hypothetical protein